MLASVKVLVKPALFDPQILLDTPSPLPDDDHWVIDTDYDNYAVHYSCRLVDSTGICLDSYSFIFSRHATGLRLEDQQTVQQKKASLCLQGKYRRVAHNGEFVLCVQAFIDEMRY